MLTAMIMQTKQRATRPAAAILLLALALILLAGCGGSSDSGGSSGAEGLLVGYWQRIAGDASLPEALIFSKGGAGLAVSGEASAPFTWMLAGQVLISNLGGEAAQSTVTWLDDGGIEIEGLVAGSGASTWARAQ